MIKDFHLIEHEMKTIRGMRRWAISNQREVFLFNTLISLEEYEEYLLQLSHSESAFLDILRKEYKHIKSNFGINNTRHNYGTSKEDVFYKTKEQVEDYIYNGYEISLLCNKEYRNYSKWMMGCIDDINDGNVVNYIMTIYFNWIIDIESAEEELRENLRDIFRGTAE